jgi:excisionase family DNA binding protein
MSVILLTKKEAAEVLGLSTVTVDRLRNSGSLGFRKFGGLIRFTEQDIQEFIEQSSVKPESSRQPAEAVK